MPPPSNIKSQGRRKITLASLSLSFSLSLEDVSLYLSLSLEDVNNENKVRPCGNERLILFSIYHEMFAWKHHVSPPPHSQ